MSPSQVTEDTFISGVREAMALFPADRWPAGFHEWENVRHAHRETLYEVAGAVTIPRRKEGRGVLIVGGGKYCCSAYVTVRMYRHVGCTLPIVLAYLGENEMDDFHRDLFTSLGVELMDVTQIPEWKTMRLPKVRETGWIAKSYAMRAVRFRHVIYNDADCYPVENPEHFFDSPEYQKHGVILWPDNDGFDLAEWKWKVLLGKDLPVCPSLEAGEMVWDTVRCWNPLNAVCWINNHSDYFYRFFWGDKESWGLGMKACGASYAMPDFRWTKLDQALLLQFDLGSSPKVAWVHRCLAKATLASKREDRTHFWTTPQTGMNGVPFIPTAPMEREFRGYFNEYKRLFYRQPGPTSTFCEAEPR